MSQQTVPAQWGEEYERERLAVGIEVVRALIELRIRIIDRLGFDPGALEQVCTREIAGISSNIRRSRRMKRSSRMRQESQQTVPYRDQPPRRIIQITASESGNGGRQWSVIVHALDDHGDVWRSIAIADERGKLDGGGPWVQLPAFPPSEDLRQD